MENDYITQSKPTDEKQYVKQKRDIKDKDKPKEPEKNHGFSAFCFF
ncbi:MAG: hypothetical protein ACK521_12835 [bacterium]